MRSWACILCLLATGCALDVRLPEGRIQCQQSSDCPTNWFCIRDNVQDADGVCYRTDQGGGVSEAGVRDGGVTHPDASGGSLDGGGSNNGTDDASVRDGGPVETDGSLTPDGGANSGSNQRPVITAVVLSKGVTTEGTKVSVSCLASDPDDDTLSFSWSAKDGAFDDESAKATLYDASDVGAVDIRCSVSDGKGGKAEKVAPLRVYPSGLVTLLPFSLDSKDRSGNGNDAAVNLGVFQSDRAGNASSAIELADADADITLLNESAYDLPGFTFVATLKPTAANNTRTVVAKASSGFGAFTVVIYGDNDPSLPRRMQFVQQSQMETYALVLGNHQVVPGQFFQLAISRSESGELRAYVDGVLIFEKTNLPAMSTNDSPVVLGNGVLGAFRGIMDEVQFYARDLPMAQVQALTMLQ